MIVEGTALHWSDILIIVLYFISLITIGTWSACRGRRSTISDYFLAGRSTPWFLVGTSLFASNVGSEHFVGLAGSGAASGIAVSGFELQAAFTMVVLGWLFVPVYISSGVYTMPEYLQKRYGGQRIRVYLSVLTLLIYVLAKISTDLYSGALFIQQSLRWDIYTSICVILSLACIFTIAGGLKAVLWVDCAQVIIMVSGAFVLMGITFNKVGGYSGLVEGYMSMVPGNKTGNSTCGLPRADSMHIFRSPTTGDLPWTGMTFGLSISAVWYWCTDQLIIQRILAAKNYSHAKCGCILNGWLKVLPLWIMIFPGMAARVLYPDEVGCHSPEHCFQVCGSHQGCSNIAYPLLVVRLMPNALRGMMLSVMLASLMGSLTSIFNSCSTLFTIDIWLRIRPNAETLEQLIVGKVSVLVFVVISVLWIPLINAFPGHQLFQYMQSVTSYMTPPITSVFVLAIFVPRVNEQGAFWGLMAGLTIGLTRFILELAYGAPRCGFPDHRPLILSKVHYLHFGIMLFFVVTVVAIVVSLFTPPIDKKYLHRLTFWTRYSEEPREVAGKTPLGVVSQSSMNSTSKQTTLRIDSLERNATSRKHENGLKLDTSKDAGSDSTSVLSQCFAFTLKICGLSHAGEEVEDTEQHSPMISLKEKPFWKYFCDVNAVILLGLGIFVWSFWG